MSIRLLSLAGAASLVLLTAACATAPAGMQAGRFVDYACDNNARFSARLADDGKTVRVRSIHGAAALRKACVEVRATTPPRFGMQQWTTPSST